jgi:hypothetical protein
MTQENTEDLEKQMELDLIGDSEDHFGKNVPSPDKLKSGNRSTKKP